MKNILYFLCAIFVLSSCTADSEPNDISRLSIIPRPLEITSGYGSFEFDATTGIDYDDSNPEIGNVVDYLINRFNAAWSDPTLVLSAKTKRIIHLEITDTYDSSMMDEGYHLSVDKKQISILSNKAKGLFYGIQTLFQLMPVSIYGNERVIEEVSIPCLEITDAPRYEYRGMHLDPCRHFVSVDFTKKYLDYLAYHKMNVFHWHLTEDQGWRIEIKKYPKLTEIGSIRSETVIPPQLFDESKNKYDGQAHGGFYSQEDIKEIVQYASDRFIDVIPEIEMPGHSRAALASYPNLGCTGGPYEVLTRWGVKDDNYCAGNDAVFAFLESVIDEVVELFPSEYIHIGGDEAPKNIWEQCNKCQERIRNENLEDENDLQSYFIRRMEKYINSKGKTIIGWSEIMEGGIAPNAVLESWLGVKGGVKVAQQHHKVIMSPYSHLYLDGIQVEPKYKNMEPWGQRYCWTTVEKVYSFEPTPDTIPTEYHPYFIGAEGTMWTEYISSEEHLEYMLLPRLSALSEICWTAKERKEYDNFKHRLNSQYLRYNAMNANFRIPHPEGLKDTIEVAVGDSIHIVNPSSVTSVFYTLDGTEPGSSSTLYTKPFVVNKNSELKTRSVMTNGKTSSVFTSQVIIR